MAVPIVGNAGVVADVDEARNFQVFQGIPGYPAAGGHYSSTGWSAAAGTPATGAVCAAALATDVCLMTARFAAASTRKAYLTRLRVALFPVTANAAAVIPGILGLQRFATATPTGGNARVAARYGPTKGSASDMTDIRDLNAALTVTSVVFGDMICSSPVPVIGGAIAAGTYQAGWEWVVEFTSPVELSAGDGVTLRTRTAFPATCTWTFSWNMYWFER